ncbi:MAG: YfiR family protein [Novosphingobium sp.]
MNRFFRILGAVAVISSMPAHGAADMPLGANVAGGDPFAGAVARTVKAMVDYTRWPQKKTQLVLCVAGRALHASQLGGWRTSTGIEVQRRNIYAFGNAVSGCDILYIGSVPIAAQRDLTSAVRGKGVLTIAEDDPANSSEAMFALDYSPQSLSFRLNIDAVSRSGLRVDPRVLRIAKARY